jgi:hypothetical protein
MKKKSTFSLAKDFAILNLCLFFACLAYPFLLHLETVSSVFLYKYYFIVWLVFIVFQLVSVKFHEKYSGEGADKKEEGKNV